MTPININEELMKAVELHNVMAVENFLKNGADADYVSDRPEYQTDSEHQPTTPLRMVMFCISDSLLEENDLKEFAEIAEVLLAHGADPEPALQLAELRYGKYNQEAEKNPFMEVWDIIAREK
jgi:hypothetical protein